MKKYIGLIVALVLCPMLMHARYVAGVGHGDYHFGYISLSGGYTSLSQDVRNVTTRGSWGGLLGAGYEFRMNQVWVSVGLQYQQLQSQTKVGEYDVVTSFYENDVVKPLGGSDNQLPPQKVDYYRYRVHQTDKQVFRTVDIPIMVGYYNNGFYVGAGAKVGFSVGSTITTGGDFNLSARYTEVMGDPNYFNERHDWNVYHPYTCREAQYECKLRPQVSLIGEIGYDLLSSLSTNSKVCHVLKIGVYGEYGLRSVRPDDSLDPIMIAGKTMKDAAVAKSNVCDARMTPYYLSTETAGKRIVPFYVGIKLTYMIGGSWSSTATWHRGCQCYSSR